MQVLESRPDTSIAQRYGLIFLVCLMLLDIILLVLLFNEPLTFASFVWGVGLLVSIPTISWVGYWTSALGNVRYSLAEGALLVTWGRVQRAIPIEEIDSIVHGGAFAEVRRFRGIRWPGYFCGSGTVVSRTLLEHDTLFFATRPLREQILVITPDRTYAISPPNPQEFTLSMRALQESGLLGARQLEGEAVDDFSIWSWSLWGDRTAWLMMATAVALNLFLFAFLTSIYTTLPATVPLHYDVMGTISEQGAPANLFILPFIGFLTWLTNGMLALVLRTWSSDRFSVYLLLGGGIVVQILTLWSLLSLLF